DASRTTTCPVSPQSAGGGTSAGRSYPKQCCRKGGHPRSTLSRLVSRTRERGQIACVPHGSYRRATSLHPAFAECIRRLFGLPTRLTMTAIREHTEMQQVAARLSKETGTPVSLPSYKGYRYVSCHRPPSN